MTPLGTGKTAPPPLEPLEPPEPLPPDPLDPPLPEPLPPLFEVLEEPESGLFGWVSAVCRLFSAATRAAVARRRFSAAIWAAASWLARSAALSCCCRASLAGVFGCAADLVSGLRQQLVSLSSLLLDNRSTNRATSG